MVWKSQKISEQQPPGPVGPSVGALAGQKLSSSPIGTCAPSGCRSPSPRCPRHRRRCVIHGHQTGASGGQLQDLGEELPGPGDGLALEVVVEREVAQHLEERVVPRVRPTFMMSLVRMHFWQVVAEAKPCAPRPRNMSLNWDIPATVNSVVGSFSGTRLADAAARSPWPRKRPDRLPDLGNSKRHSHGHAAPNKAAKNDKKRR